MSEQLYARVNPDSRYAAQDRGVPFPVSLNTNPNQVKDGYLIAGGPGGNYRPEDLDFYCKRSGSFQKIDRR